MHTMPSAAGAGLNGPARGGEKQGLRPQGQRGAPGAFAKRRGGRRNWLQTGPRREECLVPKRGKSWSADHESLPDLFLRVRRASRIRKEGPGPVSPGTQVGLFWQRRRVLTTPRRGRATPAPLSHLPPSLRLCHTRGSGSLPGRAYVRPPGENGDGCRANR